MILQWKRFIAIGAFLNLVSAVYQRKYTGDELLRLQISSESQWNIAKEILKEITGKSVDTWHEQLGQVDVHVPANAAKVYKRYLQTMAIPHTVMIPDIQRLIDQEQIKLKEIRAANPTKVVGTYATYDEIVQWMRNISLRHPGLASVLEIGQTFEGRTMNVLTLGLSGSDKINVWLDGGVHAREWISPATVIYIIDQLVKGYEAMDSEIIEFLTTMTLHIQPVSNPDGYDYTHTVDRLWRKNLNPNSGGCVGVDLNRNWDFQWGGVGSSNLECEFSYRGVSPASELETQNMVNYMNTLTRLHSYTSFHSYGQLFFTRWSYTATEFPADHDELLDVAQRASEAITAVHGTPYLFGIAPDLMYAFAGGSDDWARGARGIKWTYLLELRGEDFILPEDQIIPSGEETWEGYKVILREVHLKGPAIP